MIPVRLPLVAVCVVAVVGCDAVTGPDLSVPPDAVRTEPLDVYWAWYAEVEACTGVEGSFADVRWFEVPYVQWWDPVWEQYTRGTWRAPHDIYIAGAHRDDEQLVKHEMVHDVLRGGLTYDPRFLECSGLAHRP